MNPLPLLDNGDNLIQAALKVLESRLRYTTEHESFASPADARAFCVLRLAQREHEVFAALWLNNRHRLLAYEELFRGTIDGCSVHPREVVKSALQHNAAAVIFTHNHPSGMPEPSRADEHLTRRLKDALALIEVRTLDHIVVGATTTVSFAERGLL